MDTASCSSSNGRSCGPAVQTKSLTCQPGPDAKGCAVIVMALQYSNFSQAAARRGELGTANPSHSKGSRVMTASPSQSFIDALHTDRPAPDRADKMGLYGWLIGNWEMDAVYYLDDGSTRR